MLTDRKLAVFIDVDNANMTADNFQTALDELTKRGTIVYGKVYGLSERKHKEIITKANDLAFDLATVMRIKKRGSKPVDTRIFIDALDVVYSYPNVDAVAVLTGIGDLVPLYSKLRALDIKVLALGNADEQSLHFVDEILDLGLPAEEKPKKEKPVTEPSSVPTEEVASEPQKEVASVGAEPETEEPIAEETHEENLDEKEILDQIEKLKSSAQPVSDETVQLMDQLKKLIEEDL